MISRNPVVRPKTASAATGKQVWSRSSSAISLSRPSVSAGRPPDGRGDSLTPRPPRRAQGYTPAMPNPRHDPTAVSQISKNPMVRLGTPGTPETSTDIPKRSRDRMLNAAAWNGEATVEFRCEHENSETSEHKVPEAAQQRAEAMTSKCYELEQDRDNFRRMYEESTKEIRRLKSQISDAHACTEILERKDITIEKFFEVAAARSNASSRQGLVALGDQFLPGGSAMQGTVQQTINGLGGRHLRKKRPHTAGTQDFQAQTRDASQIVPKPRFWGTRIVEDYSLDDLRDALSTVGVKGSDHFPRTNREVERDQVRAELIQERKHHQHIWSTGIGLVSELFGHELDPLATPEDVVRVFEEKLARKLHGDNCIIYFLHHKTNHLSCTSKKSRRHRQFPLSTGMVGRVQRSRKTVIATDLMRMEGDGWKHFNINVEAERVSAIASPCYDDHKRMLAVVEVSRAESMQFTRSDQRVLELACVLLVEIMGRTKVASDLAYATTVMDTTIECLHHLANPNIVAQINAIAETCRGLIKAGSARVWLMDQRMEQLFVNTEEEAEVMSCAVGVGNVGFTVHSRTTEGKVLDDVPVLCGPIIDRNSEVLGVVEMTGRAPSRPGPVLTTTNENSPSAFSKRDESIVAAYCAVLANYVEHTQYVHRMRSTLGSIRHVGDEALEAINASSTIRESIRQVLKESSIAHARRGSISPLAKRSVHAHAQGRTPTLSAQGSGHQIVPSLGAPE